MQIIPLLLSAFSSLGKVAPLITRLGKQRPQILIVAIRYDTFKDYMAYLVYRPSPISRQSEAATLGIRC